MATEVSIVSVGTPSSANGRLSLDAVERVSREIGQVLKDKAARHLVVMRSTVLPGSVRRRDSGSRERLRQTPRGSFGVCFNPEFLRRAAPSGSLRPAVYAHRVRRSERWRAGRAALCESRRPDSSRQRRNRGNGQVCLQRVSRGQDHVRQRDGNGGAGLRRRQPCRHESRVCRHQVEHLAEVKCARASRSAAPAFQRCPRPPLPRSRGRHRFADDAVGADEQPVPQSSVP